MKKITLIKHFYNFYLQNSPSKVKIISLQIFYSYPTATPLNPADYKKKKQDLRCLCDFSIGATGKCWALLSFFSTDISNACPLSCEQWGTPGSFRGLFIWPFNGQSWFTTPRMNSHSLTQIGRSFRVQKCSFILCRILRDSLIESN